MQGKQAQTFRGPSGFRKKLVSLQRKRKAVSVTKLIIALVEEAGALDPETIALPKTSPPSRGGGATVPGNLVEPITIRAPLQTWETLTKFSERVGVSRNITLVSLVNHFGRN